MAFSQQWLARSRSWRSCFQNSLETYTVPDPCRLESVWSVTPFPRVLSLCFNETTFLHQRRLKSSFLAVSSEPQHLCYRSPCRPLPQAAPLRLREGEVGGRVEAGSSLVPNRSQEKLPFNPVSPSPPPLQGQAVTWVCYREPQRRFWARFLRAALGPYSSSTRIIV